MSGGRKRPVGRDERKSQLTKKAKKSRRSGSMAMSGQVCVSKFSFLFSRHFFQFLPDFGSMESSTDRQGLENILIQSK